MSASGVALHLGGAIRERRAQFPQKRRGDRITAFIPIEVWGTDVNQRAFFDHTKTTNVSRHGAAIVLDRTLSPGNIIVIRQLDSGREAQNRVVGVLGDQSGARLYSLALVDPAVNFWNFGFPTPSEARKAVVPILLKCENCLNSKVTYLSEVEKEVFAASSSITRTGLFAGIGEPFLNGANRVQQAPGVRGIALARRSSASIFIRHLNRLYTF